MTFAKTFSTRTKLTISAIAAALFILPVSAGLANAQSSAPAAVNWQITLTHGPSYPKATGTSQYQTQVGQRDFQAEVDHIPSLAGKHVIVKANGSVVGRPIVTSIGHAQVSRNTELGQVVPKIVHGSKVVITTVGGLRIVSGTF
jgi:hypothetical protein